MPPLSWKWRRAAFGRGYYFPGLGPVQKLTGGTWTHFDSGESELTNSVWIDFKPYDQTYRLGYTIYTYIHKLHQRTISSCSVCESVLLNFCLSAWLYIQRATLCPLHWQELSLLLDMKQLKGLAAVLGCLAIFKWMEMWTLTDWYLLPELGSVMLANQKYRPSLKNEGECSSQL